MTLYAGRKAEIRTYADGYDGEQLTTADGVVATITIWDLDGSAKLVNEAVMVYDAAVTFKVGTAEVTRPGWTYLWTTPAVAGAYKARITFTGATIDAPKFFTIRSRAVPIS